MLQINKTNKDNHMIDLSILKKSMEEQDQRRINVIRAYYDDQISRLKIGQAVARSLLGQVTARSIQISRIEQLAAIDGAGDHDAREVAKFLDQCDKFCADYDAAIERKAGK